MRIYYMSKQSKTIRRTKRKRVLKKTRRKQKGGGKTTSVKQEKEKIPARKKRTPAKQEKKPSVSKQQEEEEETDDVCAICLEDLEPEDNIISCVNEHKFHDTCIRPWCSGRRPCPCPICRGVVVDATSVQHDIYAPVPVGQVITGQGYPRGLQFTLLPPSFGNSQSAISPDRLRRWPPDYRPTTDEIRDWGIRMPLNWWTEPGVNNLPVGWYEDGDRPITLIDGVQTRDPAFRGSSTTVYEEDAYKEDLADAPSWIIIEDEEFEPPPPPPPPRSWFSWR
jgi:hypothetical protein